MLTHFIRRNSLMEADVIIAKKRTLGIFDHFIIYMGFHQGQHLFIANDATGGVKWFMESEVADMTKMFSPKAIRRFEGTWLERRQALDRAVSELGKSYSLTEFNCEHLANYVQYGVRQSPQVNEWKVALGLAAGLGVAAFIFSE